jgi:hypothetical protein
MTESPDLRCQHAQSHDVYLDKLLSGSIVPSYTMSWQKHRYWNRPFADFGFHVFGYKFSGVAIKFSCIELIFLD